MTADYNTRQKSILRQKIKAKLNALTDDERREQNCLIAVNLESLPIYKKAQKVMFYVGVEQEVNTTPLIARALAAGKDISVPICVVKERKLIVSQLADLRELERGYYGLLEPAAGYVRPREPGELEIVIVPGLAFDPEGNRLGQGGGYYDRFITQLQPDTTLIALAFAVQVVEQIPTEPHDRPIHILVTPNQIINCASFFWAKKERE
ncbi:MAG: 5-formyltetrahydrofolate cyclo-ligase [bacterium]|jgi:5-formyltetrahydrofolate cyclo-ligase